MARPGRLCQSFARAALAAVCATALALAAPAWAAKLRVASAFDPQTLDPHSIALLYHSRISTQVYSRIMIGDALV
jgi:peptide/nickel transport system substrate-binding protein